MDDSTASKETAKEATPAEWREGEAFPSEFVCPGCEYDLGRATLPRCPECGRDVLPLDISLIRIRRLAKKRAVRALCILVVSVCVLVVVFAVLWTWLTPRQIARYTRVGELRLAILSPVVFVLGSLGGLLFSRFLSRSARLPFTWAWIRAIEYLCFPWMLAVALACGMVAGGMLASIIGSGLGLAVHGLTVIAGGAFWMFAAVPVCLSWPARFRTALQQLGWPSDKAGLMVMLLGWAVAGSSFVLSATILFTGVYFARQIFSKGG